jgi:hypothetical protein
LREIAIDAEVLEILEKNPDQVILDFISRKGKVTFSQILKETHYSTNMAGMRLYKMRERGEVIMEKAPVKIRLPNGTIRIKDMMVYSLPKQSNRVSRR